MSKFLTGIAIEACVLVAHYIYYYMTGSSVPTGPFVIIFIFDVIGLYYLISGGKKIFENIMTSKNGVQCYGVVRDIKITNANAKENIEYKAMVQIVNPDTNQLEDFEENIGSDCDKYPVYSGVLCKYYQRDVNIIKKIDISEIPDKVKKRLIIMQGNLNNGKVEFSPDGEYVTIDGVKYKKK